MGYYKFTEYLWGEVNNEENVILPDNIDVIKYAKLYMIQNLTDIDTYNNEFPYEQKAKVGYEAELTLFSEEEINWWYLDKIRELEAEDIPEYVQDQDKIVYIATWGAESQVNYGENDLILVVTASH